MFSILIAVRDINVQQQICDFMSAEGYIVYTTTNIGQALSALDRYDLSLLIADTELSSESCVLIRKIREGGSDIPLISISEKTDYETMRIAFTSGADDFMAIPVAPGEMLLRAAALLRRTQIKKQHKLVIGKTIFELDTMRVTQNNETVFLPQKEFLLIYKMASAPGQIFGRRQLMEEIWPFDSASGSHTIDVHIGRIRERFRENEDFRIVTVRGAGYKQVKN